jgi:hypothetical protein
MDGFGAMTEEKQPKRPGRKAKDRQMLESVLEVLELVESDCRHVHTWQFYRDRQGEPDPHIFTRTVKELRDYLSDG